MSIVSSLLDSMTELGLVTPSERRESRLLTPFSEKLIKKVIPRPTGFPNTNKKSSLSRLADLDSRETSQTD